MLREGVHGGMKSMKIVKCQHCHKRTAFRQLDRGIAFASCPHCGQQTPTRPPVATDGITARVIEDPAKYLE